jgi:hypothetical protein
MENKNMSNESNDETYFCLYGKDAKPYFKNRIGDSIKLTVEAVITELGIEDSDGDQTPVVEFRVVEVSGKKKSYDEMEAGEFEREVHDVLNNDQPEPNREDGESIWSEIREQEKLNQRPFTRPKPFNYR